MSSSLLEVRELRVTFAGERGALSAVRGLDLDLAAGRTLALVGESGSGKSATALAIARLLPANAQLTARRLALGGSDVLSLTPAGLRALRGRDLGLVFQDPGAALDPLMRVGPQVAEGPRLGSGLSADEAAARALGLFERVGLPDARATWLRFPHQLSGGQRQRVGLAMALAGEPRLLVADEPTTALDVTLQAQVLTLLGEEVSERGMGLLLIAHDLAVVARLAHEVAVVYAGRVVERAPTRELFARPRHPYTRALLRARPERAPRGTRLEPIGGQVPDPSNWPSGCAFRTRCPLALARCAQELPVARVPDGAAQGHLSACHLAEEVPAP